MANSYSGGSLGSRRGSTGRGGRGGGGGGLLVLLALGALGAGAYALLRKPGELVSAKSGKTWRVVFIDNVNGVKTYELFAPAQSFGPHEELSVMRYSQTGSDTASRKIVGVGSGVPQVMVQTAASDFGVPFNPALMPAS